MIVYGTWEIIRSDFVASYISKKVSEVLNKQENLIVSFEKLEVNPIDMGVSVKNVVLEAPTFGGTVDSLHLNLGFFSFFKSKISLNEIIVEGGEFYVDRPSLENKSETKKKEKVNYRELLDNVFDHKAFERFRKIQVNHSSLQVDDDFIQFNEFYVHNFREIKILAGTIRVQSDLLAKNNIAIDGLNVNATLSRNKLTISPLVIRSDIDRINLKGEVVFNKKGIPVTSGGLEILFSSDKVNKFFDLGFEGQVSANVSFGGLLDNMQADIDIFGRNLKSKFYKFKKLSSKLKLLNEKLVVETLSASPARGNLRLNEKHTLYDFRSNQLNIENLSVALEEVHTRDALFFLGDSLDIMDLTMNGGINISYLNDVFDIKLQEKFNLKKALLGKENSASKILEIKDLNFTSGYVRADLKSNETKIVLQSGTSDFNIGVDGVITSENTFFKVLGDNVDLSYIGSIASVELKGKGLLDMEISANEEALIAIDLDMQDFGIVNFNLGNSKGRATYNITNGFIDIKNLHSRVRNSTTRLSGSYDIESSVLLLNGKHIDSNILDILSMTSHYLKVPEEVQSKLDGKVTLQYVIDGPVDMSKMTMKGFLQTNILSFDEILLKDLSVDFGMKNGVIKVPSLVTNLFNGKLNAQYEYHLANSYQDIDFTISKASISGVPYLPKFTNPIKGTLNIEGFGAGRPEDFNLKIGVDINNLSVSNQLYRKNYVDFIWDTDNLLIDLDFFNSQLITKSNLVFAKDASRKSFVKASANFDSLNPFFYTINSNLRSRQSSLRSRLAANFEIIADIPNEEVERMSLDISDFYLRHYANTLTIKRGRNSLLYEDGLVKRGNVQIVGTNKNINYELRKINKLTFTNKFSIYLPLTFLELVVPNTEFNSGVVDGEVEYFSGLHNSFKTGEFNIKGLSFQPKDAPVTFKEFSGKVALRDRVIELEKIEGTVGRGKFTAHGSVGLAGVVPEIDLRFNLDNSLIIPFDNSKFLLSADGAIRGKELPYLIDGKIVVYHSEINESIDKLSGGTDSGGGATKSKYLPILKINEQSKFVRTSFNIDFIKPLKITNDLFSLQLIGNGTILGDFEEVKFDGQFNTIDDKENVINIKGHRFHITEAMINLKEDENDSTVRVKGTTKIKEFEIFLSVDGPLKKISVSLTSEPALAKEDIFSLITFGYTTKTSQELDQNDRNSVATVGIGSLIFDQLKIGQGLNSSLGLKMSISPEFQTQEGSLLDGKSAVSTSRRLRSATRIKLEKSFSENVDMSFSNTVGGAVQQKQEMNVIYKVNDNVSVDGVLEVREVQEESSASPESLGADLKFKWSF